MWNLRKKLMKLENFKNLKTEYRDVSRTPARSKKEVFLTKNASPDVVRVLEKVSEKT